MVEANKVPKAPEIPGIRKFAEKDVPQLAALFQEYMKKFQVHPVFSEEELRHMLTPDERERFTYIVEDSGKIVDFISFYLTSYTVLSHPTIKEYKALFILYYASTKTSVVDLVRFAMERGVETGADMAYVNDSMENTKFLEVYRSIKNRNWALRN